MVIGSFPQKTTLAACLTKVSWAGGCWEQALQVLSEMRRCGSLKEGQGLRMGAGFRVGLRLVGHRGPLRVICGRN